jgi:hypothetical protein
MKESQVSETGMFAMPHDDVVKNFDLEELAGADEIAGDADVRLGRIWLTAGMIVHNYDGMSTGDDCQSEDLARMHENGIHRPN